MSRGAPKPAAAGLARTLKFLPETLFVAATTAAGLAAGGRWLTPDGDIGAWWSLTHRLATGERLYRDVHPDNYGPLSPWFLAGLERVFGCSAAEFLLVNWLGAIAAGLALLAVARPLLSTLERSALVGILIGTSVLAAGPGRLVYPYAPGAVHGLFFSMIALLWVERDASTGFRDGLLAGAFAGLAFCCKQEIGIAAAAALWAAALVRVPSRLRWLAGTAAGFAASILPVLVVVFAAAPIDSLRADSHLWPLAARPRGQWQSAFRRVAGLSAPDWPFQLRSSAWLLLAGLVVLATACLALRKERRRSAWLRVAVPAAILGAWWLLEDRRLGTISAPIGLSTLGAAAVLAAALALPMNCRALVVGVGAFGVLTSFRTVVSTDAVGHYAGVAHFATALTWVLLLCVLAPRALGDLPVPRGTLRRVLGLGLLVVGWSSALDAAFALGITGAERFDSPRGTIYVRNAAFFRSLEGPLHSGRRVLAIPEPYALEPLFGVEGWSRDLLLLPPQLDEVERRLVRDLDRDPPDAVVVFARPVVEYEVAPFGQGYGRSVQAWLDQHAEVVVRSPGGVIYRPRRAAASPPRL